MWGSSGQKFHVIPEPPYCSFRCHSLCKFSTAAFRWPQADHKICLSLVTFPVKKCLTFAFVPLLFLPSKQPADVSLSSTASFPLLQREEFLQRRETWEKLFYFLLICLHHPLQKGSEFGLKDGEACTSQSEKQENPAYKCPPLAMEHQQPGLPGGGQSEEKEF